MVWKWISLAFLILAFFFLPFWPYITGGYWWIYASGFCVFIAILTFLVSIAAKRGSTLWRGRGQG